MFVSFLLLVQLLFLVHAQFNFVDEADLFRANNYYDDIIIGSIWSNVGRKTRTFRFSDDLQKPGFCLKFDDQLFRNFRNASRVWFCRGDRDCPHFLKCCRVMFLAICVIPLPDFLTYTPPPPLFKISTTVITVSPEGQAPAPEEVPLVPEAETKRK